MQYITTIKIYNISEYDKSHKTIEILTQINIKILIFNELGNG